MQGGVCACLLGCVDVGRPPAPSLQGFSTALLSLKHRPPRNAQQAYFQPRIQRFRKPALLHGGPPHTRSPSFCPTWAWITPWPAPPQARTVCHLCHPLRDRLSSPWIAIQIASFPTRSASSVGATDHQPPSACAPRFSTGLGVVVAMTAGVSDGNPRAKSGASAWSPKRSYRHCISGEACKIPIPALEPENWQGVSCPSCLPPS